MIPTRFAAFHPTAAHGAASVGVACVADRRYGFGYWFSTGVPEAMS